MKQYRLVCVFVPWLIACPALADGATADATARQAALDLLPAETLAFYYGEPAEAAFGTGAALHWVLRGVELAGQLGQLPARTRLLTDLLGCLPLLGRYPQTVALLDVRARRLADDVYRLASLEAVLILETDGENKLVERHIRELLGSQTNSDVSRLEEALYEGVKVHRLIDSRVPDWAVVEWAAVGQFYVVGVGDGALRRVIEAARTKRARLASDEWFDWAYKQCRGPRADVMWLVHFDGLRSRLARVIRGRTERVIEALGAAGVEQSFWSVSRSGRAISARCAYRAAGRNRLVTISDPAAASPQLLAVVPPGAPSFAVMEVDLDDWIRRLCRAYLASQAVATGDRIQRWWNDLQNRLGLDAEAELLDQLGGHLVIHTYPEHPWRVPLLCTLLFEIKGDAASVRRCLDQLMTAWQAALAGNPQVPGGARPGARLRRSDDGIWYFEFGVFVVLGVAVEDRWIVVSYSPEAARANVAFLRSRAPGVNPRLSSPGDRTKNAGPARSARYP